MHAKHYSICYTLPTIPNQVNPTTGDLPFFLFCAPPLCSFRPRRRRRRPTRPSPFFAHFTSIFATETKQRRALSVLLISCRCVWMVLVVAHGRTGEPPMDVHSVPVLRSLLPLPSKSLISSPSLASHTATVLQSTFVFLFSSLFFYYSPFHLQRASEMNQCEMEKQLKPSPRCSLRLP